jgi:hypothetical protein
MINSLRKGKVPADIVEVWKTFYLCGYSMGDLRAYEAAKGRSTSEEIIKDALRSCGVELRGQQEALELSRARAAETRKHWRGFTDGKQD